MRKIYSAGFVLALMATVAHATEGGGSNYPRGVENFLVGAAPPPGFYSLLYGNVYSADKLKDNRGDDIPVPGFKVEANAVAWRGIWTSTTPILGGTLGMHAIVPLLDLKVSAAGSTQRKTGLADITVGPIVAWHHSQQLHSVLGVDFTLPTGRYEKNDLANLGRNYYSVAPLYTMSYVDAGAFNGDFKLTLNLNARNKDTEFRSGKELFLDYSVGWGLGNGWTLGLGGHVWQQLDNDKLSGVTVADNKVRAFAIGPSIKYENGRGWFLTAKLQGETAVRNSTEGTAFWVKTLIPF